MSTLYAALGEQDGLRRLVDAFYDHMDTRPDSVTIRKMHPPDLTEARRRLWMFLVGWSGGPQLFVEERGHPRLRARHLPFAIDEAARDAWLSCFVAAMDDCGIEGEVRVVLFGAIARLADHMRNVEVRPPHAG